MLWLQRRQVDFVHPDGIRRQEPTGGFCRNSDLLDKQSRRLAASLSQLALELKRRGRARLADHEMKGQLSVLQRNVRSVIGRPIRSEVHHLFPIHCSFRPLRFQLVGRVTHT